MFKWTCALSAFFLFSSCSHTVDFKTSHYAVPYVSEKNWGGSVSASVGAPSKITFVDDINTNPPTRSGVKINQDADLASLLLLDTIFVEAELGLATTGLELFYEKGTNGIRWQFLGHGSSSNHWVASIQGGAGSFSDSTTDSGDTANTKITSQQKALSIGYKTDSNIIYSSVVENKHSGSTDVNNSGGSHGPYEDDGTHTHYALGVSSYGTGFLYNIEYNYLNLKWDGVSAENQESLSVRLGYEW